MTWNETGSPGDGIPWLALDAEGRADGVVHAPNALAAVRALPPGTSLYVGGPSAARPDRPWWTENWRRSRPVEGGGDPRAGAVPGSGSA